MTKEVWERDTTLPRSSNFYFIILTCSKEMLVFFHRLLLMKSMLVPAIKKDLTKVTLMKFEKG